MRNNNVVSGSFRRGSSSGDNTSGGGGSDMLEKRVERLEADVIQVRLDLSVLTTRSETFSTKSDIERLRTEHQTLRADLVTKVAESERRTLDKIDAASLRHTNELNAFKSTLLLKIGLPVLIGVIACFGTVITLLVRLLAKSAGLSA